MIAALLSVLVLAGEPANAPPPPAPAGKAPASATPPHERPIVERQFAAPRSAAAAALSGPEADKLYSLYLSRIGQLALSSSRSGGDRSFSEGDSQPR